MIYHRFNNRETPYNDTPLMMFAEDELSVEHYGENHWVLDTAHIPTIKATDDIFVEAMREWLENNLNFMSCKFYAVEEEGFIEAMIDLANPKNIVESAGFWDCDDIMACFIDEVINERGWWVIETQDRAICFDPEFVRRAE